MKDNSLFVGFDTSNYTTSIAVANYDGEILLNLKQLLPVNDGEKGLRQSDAVFHHTNNIFNLLENVRIKFSSNNYLAIGASERPRDIAKSYMPCFLVGRDVAKSFSIGSNSEYYDFSHQAGHIMAALYSSKRLDLIGKEFIAFHVSGGTTDVLLIKPSPETVFEIKRIGGTNDLNAGQLIDRTGVMLGLKFPCGPEIEKLAKRYDGEIPNFKVSVVNDFNCNLSGVQNMIEKIFHETGNVEYTSMFTIQYILKTIEIISDNLYKSFNLPIVYAGGVMSCSIIKESLSKFGSFAEPSYSSDNASGIALLARHRYLSVYGT